MSDFYILMNGKPRPEPDLHKWADWFANPRNRVIARSYLDRAGTLLPVLKGDLLKQPRSTFAAVSTVFLASDHNFWHSGPPILYETMIYLPNEERLPHQRRGEEWLAPQWRYYTADEARASHDRIVQQASVWLAAGRDLRTIDCDEWHTIEDEGVNHDR